MITPYATSEDLTGNDWVDEADLPDDVDRKLQAASLLVNRATRNAIYDTDGVGVPSDIATAEAMRDAVCAQVSAWIALGVDPVVGPAAGADTTVLTGKSIGSASMSYSVDADALRELRQASTSLTPMASQILDDAGLLVRTVGRVY